MRITSGIMKKENARVSTACFYQKKNSVHTNNLSASYYCKNKCINCFVWLYMSACPLGYFGMNCSSKCVHPYYGLKCKSKCSCYNGDCHHIHGCNPNPGGEFSMIKYIYVLLIYQTVHSKIIFNDFRTKFNPSVTDNLN